MTKVIALAVLAAAALPVAYAQRGIYAGDVPYTPKPAFPEQTRAPKPSTPSPDVKVETITNRLTSPWSEVLLPDGNFLVTESIGTMRIVRPDGVVSAPLAGVPGVKVVAAQGLHDIVLDPDFAHNRIVYFTYFAPPPGEAPAIWPTEFFYQKVWTKPLAERRTMRIGMERMARARLSDDERSLENVQTLVQGAERRIVLAPDGTLFVTGADRFRFYESKYDGMEHPFNDADLRRKFTGSVLRINRDGSIPKDNPWLSSATAPAALYAFGLRDPEGAAINPATGELWTTDHGPQGGDEINIIHPGHDYGWPNVSYGTQYDFQRTDGRKNVPVGTGKTSMPGVDEPAYFWNPDIAPSGMLFYTGDLFPQWKGSVFVGGMAAQALVRLVLNGNRVAAEEHLLTGHNYRVRDIKQAPDGSIYLLAGDALLHVTPK